MATSVAASYPGGDISQQRFRPSSHPRQSILPLRRERTIIDGALCRSHESKPVYSRELPVRSTAFSGGINQIVCDCSILINLIFSTEKQYDRRQVPIQIRSAKSEEVKYLL